MIDNFLTILTKYVVIKIVEVSKSKSYTIGLEIRSIVTELGRSWSTSKQ